MMYNFFGKGKEMNVYQINVSHDFYATASQCLNKVSEGIKLCQKGITASLVATNYAKFQRPVLFVALRNPGET